MSVSEIIVIFIFISQLKRTNKAAASISIRALGAQLVTDARLHPLGRSFSAIKCSNKEFTRCLPVCLADFWQVEAQHGRDSQENKHKPARASLPGNKRGEPNKKNKSSDATAL